MWPSLSILSKYIQISEFISKADPLARVMLTHPHSNGKGLASKPPQFRDECVSVRDSRFSKANFQQQSKHPALVTKPRQDKRNYIKDTSTAHFTQPVCRSYNLHVIDSFSSLTEESTARLLALYDIGLNGGAR